VTTLAHQTFEPKRKADLHEEECEKLAQKDRTIKALMHRIDALEAQVVAAQKQAAGRLQWRTLT
jgi:hypothetical protein